MENIGDADVVVNATNPLYTKRDTEAVPMARTANDVALQLDATLIFPGNVYNFGASMPALLTEATVRRMACVVSSCAPAIFLAVRAAAHGWIWRS